MNSLFSVVCGLGGAFYVWVHRQYVFFMRSNKVLNKFLQKNRFLYPGILAFMVSRKDYEFDSGINSSCISGRSNLVSKWIGQVYCR